MYFIHTWQKVIAKQKTATRRPWIDQDYTRIQAFFTRGTRKVALYSEVMSYAGKKRYLKGDRIPVMPFRGIKGSNKVADLLVDALWMQDVRQITDSDAEKEGFEHVTDFLIVWCQMYKLPPLKYVEIGGEWDTDRFYAEIRRGKDADYRAAVIEWLPETLVLYPDAIATAHQTFARKRSKQL